MTLINSAQTNSKWNKACHGLIILRIISIEVSTNPILQTMIKTGKFCSKITAKSQTIFSTQGIENED